MGNTFFIRKRARKRGIEDVLSDSDNENDNDSRSPKRKKLYSTAKYIFETLFINGENNDITILALGKEWKLHKVYLCQSPYFASMFSGSWKESTQTFIRIDIADNNIDKQALTIVFGSLYRDDVLIDPCHVISVLAAATLLQLDSLVQRCGDVMNETIGLETVCNYYTAACDYAQETVKNGCIEWLERNLMPLHSTKLLKHINIDLMAKLVRSPDLFLVQVETDLYILLKRWLFLKLKYDWEGTIDELATCTDEFSKGQPEGQYFLETEEGDEYVPVFEGLKLLHILNDFQSAQMIIEDRIIPSDWLTPLYSEKWFSMLRVEQGTDIGPLEMDENNFKTIAVRCGRILPRDGEVYCWRWTGYTFGLDLVVTYQNRCISFKRNTQSQQCINSVSLQPKRNLVYRLIVASLDEERHVKHHQATGIQNLCLAKDEECRILTLEKEASFPLYVILNYVMLTPFKVDDLTQDS